MYCNKCGKEMPDTAKFCAACGAPVADKDQADISSTGETVDKGNHTKQIAGIAVASALAVMIAGGAVLHVNRNTDKTESVSAVISETWPPETESVPEPETVIDTGFVTQDGELYYYGADGELVNGWIEDNGSRYYAADEGRIYRNGTFEIDGTQYIFDENGICIGDEKTFAEEDAKLLQTLTATEKGRLTRLMEVLMHYYIDGGFHDSASITSESVQADINRLLNGEPEAIEHLFEGEMAMAQSLGYSYANEPSNVEELRQQYGYEDYLTKEQIEHLVYSICGKQLEIDLSGNPGWHEPYLGFGGAAGDITWNELRNFSVERVNADTWQVRADIYYDTEGWFFNVDFFVDCIGKVNFTVIRNPDSYFEGYSIANVEVVLTGQDAVWKDAYLRYIQNFEWKINSQIDEYVSDYGMDAQAAADMKARIQYDLIYIDDDDIPELYIGYPVDPVNPDLQGARIITYYDGQIIDSRDEYDWSFCEYIERSGLCYGEVSGFGGFRLEGVYKLENGKWQLMGLGSMDMFPYFEWNGAEVSSYEEIERNINAIYDRDRSRECGKAMSVFDLIKLIYPDAELTFDNEEYYSAENDSSSETTPSEAASNEIRYFTNNEEFVAALTQEQHDQWEELVGPNLYSQYGGQLYFDGFDGVVLRASCFTADITVTYSNNWWTGLVIRTKN